MGPFSRVGIVQRLFASLAEGIICVSDGALMAPARRHFGKPLNFLTLVKEISIGSDPGI